MQTQETTETKQYFSASPTMVLRISLGKQVLDENKMVHRLGEQIAYFQPFGKYGRYVTNDPEVQAIMDRMLANGENDIFTYEKYLELSTTPEEKLRLEKDRGLAQQVRILELENALLRAVEEREQKRAAK